MIVCLITLVLSGGVSFALYRNSQSGPEKTLSTFCTALLNNNDSLAWNLLTTQFQAEFNQTFFTRFFIGLRTCTPGTLTQNARATTMPLVLVFPTRKMTDTTTLKQDNHGDWKIADEPGITGLVRMLARFCDAMQKEDYASAYHQLSPGFQAKLLEDQFALSFTKAVSCAYSDLVPTLTPFQITFALRSLSGVVNAEQATLVLENGSWEIDDFPNLPTKTLAAFCSDLQNADYQDAYDETSTAFQGGRPLADFAQSFSNVRFCTYSELVSFNGNVTSDMNFFYTNGSLIPYTGFLVPDSNNAKWKIDQLVNFPDQILTRFCAGLNNLNYQSSYDQLTPQKKAQRTLQAFIANYGNVMRCMFTFPVQIADQATATLIYTLTDRQTSKQNVMLVAYARDTWGIQDLTNV
jgi:phage-related protein